MLDSFRNHGADVFGSRFGIGDAIAQALEGFLLRSKDQMAKLLKWRRAI
jgi:hypothetical protein